MSDSSKLSAWFNTEIITVNRATNASVTQNVNVISAASAFEMTINDQSLSGYFTEHFAGFTDF